MGKGKRTKLSAAEATEILREINDYQINKYMKAQKDLLSEIKVQVKCKSQGQKLLVKTIKEKEVTFVSGMAGTGKTYMACLQALKMLKNFAKYEKIIIAKSVTVIPGEDIGYLKGSMQEKMDPFMWSYWTNFEKIIGPSLLQRLREEGYIQVWPLAYIRGSNVDNSILLIDESQNISKNTMKTILTRLGKDSRMVFLGDSDQVDLKRKTDSALSYYVKHFKDFEPFGIVELTAEDEVRNPLISKYLEKLEEIENINKEK